MYHVAANFVKKTCTNWPLCRPVNRREVFMPLMLAQAHTARLPLDQLAPAPLKNGDLATVVGTATALVLLLSTPVKAQNTPDPAAVRQQMMDQVEAVRSLNMQQLRNTPDPAAVRQQMMDQVEAVRSLNMQQLRNTPDPAAVRQQMMDQVEAARSLNTQQLRNTPDPAAVRQQMLNTTNNLSTARTELPDTIAQRQLTDLQTRMQAGAYDKQYGGSYNNTVHDTAVSNFVDNSRELSAEQLERMTGRPGGGSFPSAASTVGGLANTFSGANDARQAWQQRTVDAFKMTDPSNRPSPPAGSTITYTYGGNVPGERFPTNTPSQMNIPASTASKPAPTTTPSPAYTPPPQTYTFSPMPSTYTPSAYVYRPAPSYSYHGR
jgi:hypothetical protein